MDHMGCKWWDGRQPSTYSRQEEPARLCVVVVGRGRMETARENMLQVCGLVLVLVQDIAYLLHVVCACVHGGVRVLLLYDCYRCCWIG